MDRTRIDELTYRPGWHFYWSRSGADVIVIEWTGPNSMPGKAEDITLRVDCDIGPADGWAEALELVYDRIAGIEAHERAEWLRWGGLCFDPEARRAHPGLYEPL